MRFLTRQTEIGGSLYCTATFANFFRPIFAVISSPYNTLLSVFSALAVGESRKPILYTFVTACFASI